MGNFKTRIRIVETSETGTGGPQDHVKFGFGYMGTDECPSVSSQFSHSYCNWVHCFSV